MCRRYKQQDFNNASFIIDILSFIVQNFNPINLDRKLDNENKRLYVKMLWDRCLQHAIARLIYSSKDYNILGDPKLTYQKANGIVRKFVEENSNNIHVLKIEMEENFKTIHYIYSLLYPKIYNRFNVFSIKSKSDFDFVFSTWKTKLNGPISPKIINKLPAPTNQLLVTQMLSKAKNPKDYQKRTVVNEFEQAPLAGETVEIINNTGEMPMPIAHAPKYMKARNFDKVDSSSMKVIELNSAKRRAEEKVELERRLSENTAKMAIVKKPKIA